MYCYIMSRSIFVTFVLSHRDVFYKKAVLKDFAIFTGKHLCRSIFLIKRQVFSCEYWDNFKNIEENLRMAASDKN